MSKDQPSSKDKRKQREAAALRANLQRRKAQAREQAAKVGPDKAKPAVGQG